MEICSRHIYRIFILLYMCLWQCSAQERPKVTVSQTAYSADYGGSITLECMVVADPPALSVYWQKNVNGQSTFAINSYTNSDKYGGTTVQNPSLTILNVNNDDAGPYTCYASNSVGTDNSVETVLSVFQNLPTVTILSTRYSVRSGETITLGCNVYSVPVHTSVTWLRIWTGSTSQVVSNTQKYSGSTIHIPSLTIKNAAESDEGVYICTASNAFGSAQSSQTQLDVIDEKLKVSVAQTGYSTNYGDTITLSCLVSGTPAAISVYWQKSKNGVTSAIDNTQSNKYSGSTVNSPSLTIINADPNDDATYICYAANALGTSESQPVVLTVNGDVPTVTIQLAVYYFDAGTDISLPCVVSGSPPVTSVQWAKIFNGVTENIDTGKPRYSGSTPVMPSLYITTLSHDDEGYYTCAATNSVGTTRSSHTYLNVTGSIPSVVVPTSQYTVLINNPVTLECSVVSYPAYTRVKWVKMVNNVLVDIVTGNSKYTGSVVNTPSLTITQATTADGGNYSCHATNSVGTGKSGFVFLDVIGGVPQVRTPYTTYTANTGKSVTLECYVSGLPKHTSVYWKRIDNNVHTVLDLSSIKYSGSTVTYPSLIISNPQMTDNADYSCYAANSIGSGNSGYIRLNVLGGVPLVNVAKKEYFVNVGESVLLNCSVKSDPPVTSVYWTITKNGITTNITTSNNYVGSTVGNPSLEIKVITSSDLGSYRCFAVNSINTGSSELVIVRLMGGKPIVTAFTKPFFQNGEPVAVINCRVDANPKETTIVWQKIINGIPTALSIQSIKKYTGGTVDTPSLTIANVTEDDEGEYICQATNVVETVSSSPVHFEVIGEAPRMTYVTPNRMVVFKGDTIAASCETTSIPKSTFKWYKDKEQPELSVGSTLRIENSKKTDSGAYTCHAMNVYGYQNVSLIVDVHYKPEIDQLPSLIIRKDIGSFLSIPCTYSANPKPDNIKWTKTVGNIHTTLDIDGTKYGGGTLDRPDLYIYNLVANDAGFYQCEVNNAIGVTEGEKANVVVDIPVDDVYVSPTFIDIIAGATLQATCASKDNSVLKYEWFLNGNLIGTGSSMGRDKSLVTDSGLYICVATYSSGTRRAAVSVNIRYAPISIVTNTEYETTVNSPVTLLCATRANPPAAEWTWYKDGTTLSDSKSELLRIDMDSLKDIGTYSCIAMNGVGQSSPIEFHVKQKQTREILTTSEGGLTSGEIAALVVGFFLCVAVTIIIVIFCFIYGICKRSDLNVHFESDRGPKSRPGSIYTRDGDHQSVMTDIKKEPIVSYSQAEYVMKDMKEPIYLHDLYLRPIQQAKPIEYTQQEPQVLYYDYPGSPVQHPYVRPTTTQQVDLPPTTIQQVDLPPTTTQREILPYSRPSVIQQTENNAQYGDRSMYSGGPTYFSPQPDLISTDFRLLNR